MADVFGRVAGAVYIHCSSDREFRDILDKLLVNEIAVAADSKRRLLAIEFGDDPEDDYDSADLTVAWRALDVVGQLGATLVTDEAGWETTPRAGEREMPAE